MPELKHGFGAAKMNKDLDERIVPNGEYRDALNIEISTSEGSHAGTMQTILGNTAITETGLNGMEPGLLSPNSRCVGSVADEQNNHIYYFVADPTNYTDYIMRYDSDADILIPIVVDKYQVEQNIFDETTSPSGDPKAYFTIPFEGAGAQNLSNVRPGMVIATNDFELAPSTPLAITFDQHYTVTEMIKKSVQGSHWWQVHIDIIEPHYGINAPIIPASDLYKYGINSYVDGVVKFRAERVLNFSVSADGNDFFPPITGINVIDGILIWTDGKSEPKKIIVEDFIKDSVLGRSGTWHTGKLHSFFNVYSPTFIGVGTSIHSPGPTNVNGLIAEPDSYNSNAKINYSNHPDSLKEEHITTIKKSPLHPPTIEMSNTSDGRFTSANTPANLISKTTADAVFVDSDGSNLPIDSIINIEFDNPYPDYLDGDLILLRKDVVNGSGAFDPSDMTEYELIVEIVEFNPANNKAKVKIVWIQVQPVNDSTTGVTNTVTTNPVTAPNVVTAASFHSILKQEKPLYEFKFPRFAFRWKYQDNQYSPYSPFSEPAFLPGLFDYVPKEGYNLGMVNTLRSIYITDFVTDSDGIPKDVIEIDILYKESNSTNIYKVKTVKFEEGGATGEWLLEGSAASSGIGPPILSHNFAQWARTTGRIQITSEMVRSAVASNQLLRPWDNVPRTAKAQEIVGNRIVYANYLQNYNL